MEEVVKEPRMDAILGTVRTNVASAYKPENAGALK